MNGTPLSYSANGNLSTDTEGRQLEYDAWNRLVRVRDGGGVLKAAYGYDGLNRRISEQVAANAAGDAATAAIRDLFYSAEWQVLEERLRSGGAVGATAEARYVWSPVYVDAMLLRERGSERVYALQDGNWNTTALIAAAGVPGKAVGEVIQRMVYNPYGEVFRLNADWTEQLGTPLVPWQHLFQGLKFSEATGLGYVRNRDYSPTVGRFIELDPIGFDAGDNNWYRFVGNGPVGRVDPSGLWLTGYHIPTPPWGPSVNMNPAVPIHGCAGEGECPRGFHKVIVDRVNRNVRWIDIVSIKETLTGYYDGLTGTTDYVFQGTFTLQRELRESYLVYECVRYEFFVNPQACQQGWRRITAGRGCEKGKYYLGATKHVFTGDMYQGQSTLDPGALLNVVSVVDLVFTPKP